LQGDDDGLGDLVLHGEDRFQGPVEVAGPQLGAARRVDEASDDAHLVLLALHAALEQVRHAQFIGE
jgi:inorganic pyrophosphatase